jgi:hypothetical protein
MRPGRWILAPQREAEPSVEGGDWPRGSRGTVRCPMTCHRFGHIAGTVLRSSRSRPEARVRPAGAACLPHPPGKDPSDIFRGSGGTCHCAAHTLSVEGRFRNPRMFVRRRETTQPGHQNKYYLKGVEEPTIVSPIPLPSPSSASTPSKKHLEASRPASSSPLHSVLFSSSPQTIDLI